MPRVVRAGRRRRWHRAQGREERARGSVRAQRVGRAYFFLMAAFFLGAAFFLVAAAFFLGAAFFFLVAAFFCGVGADRA